MSSNDRGAWLAKLEAWREKTDWLPPLLARLVLAVIFIQSGWGKLHNLSNVVEFFKTLGIPAPGLQAPFVAGVEFFGGILVLVGLFTPLAAFLLAATMVVAILTARLGDAHTLGALANLPEISFLVLLLWLVWAGAGKISIDYLLRKRRPT
ncbi:MAG TPA: DoxX family protein [Thermoanaerobaculia bacterium]|jgi:putative oxidoreductase